MIHHWNHKRILVAIFLLSCGVLCSFTYALYRQSRVVEHHDQWVAHSYEVLRKSRRILTLTLDVETGQRGYILTGAPNFLEPYTRASKELDNALADLKRETIDNPPQQAIAGQLVHDMDAYRLLLSTQIMLYEKHGIKALNKRDLNDSRRAMDGVRTDLERIIGIEKDLLKERTILTQNEQSNYQLTLFLGSGLAIVGLTFANLMILGLLMTKRRTERQLHDYEERLKLVMDGIDDGIYEYDPKTQRLDLSPSYRRLLGYDPKEIAGDVERFAALVHPDDIADATAERERFISGAIPHYASVYRIKHRDGGWRWILSRGVILRNAHGEILRMVGTHADITEQKAREAELQQLNQDLESFAYIASHDLRAPLVNLKGFSGEIDYALNDARQAILQCVQHLAPGDRERVTTALERDIPESLNFIRAAVEKMDVLTSSILDMSRIGRREYANVIVDTNQIVKRCLDTLAYEISRRRVTVECETLPDVQSDAVALEQIFGNILDNAIKYLDPARPGLIQITSRQVENQTEFTIRDNGRGIAAQDRAKVFDIFRRAANVSDIRGAGMGMAYVKAITRKIGGHIWFDSVIDEGTAFVFRLPNLATTIPSAIQNTTSRE